MSLTSFILKQAPTPWQTRGKFQVKPKKYLQKFKLNQKSGFGLALLGLVLVW